MKYLLTLAFLATLQSSFSQSIDGYEISKIETEFIEIRGRQKFLSTNIVIQVDFGQDRSFLQSGKKTSITDEEGKFVNFNSMVDALNFFAKYGYKFEQAYVVTDSSKQNVYHYLLSKKDSK